MYEINISAKAKRELRSLSARHEIALDIIYEELKDNPQLGKPLTRELIGRFSFRVGNYRIIYNINEKDKKIYILTVGHRSIVYQ